MNKELVESIKDYNTLKRNKNTIENIEPDYFFEFVDMLLNYIENSIPKEKVEEKIEETRKRYNEIHTKHLRDCGIAEQRALAQREVLEELLEGK